MKKIYYCGELIETFIFDLDGTAFGFNDSVASINSEGKVLDYICSRFSQLEIHNIYQYSKRCIDIDRKKWFSNLLKQIQIEYPNIVLGSDIETFATDLENLYWITFTQLNIPYFDFIYFVEKIKPFCKLAVITDGYIRNQKTKIFSSGLHKYFDLDKVVFSDEINAQKPSREIFDYAHKKIGYKAETSVYIGDSLAKDIAGANNSGLFSIYLKRGANVCDIPQNQSQQPRITISDYFELLNLLEIK
jgi:FMN phosphatase YigB (HAD superfamily)